MEADFNDNRPTDLLRSAGLALTIAQLKTVGIEPTFKALAEATKVSEPYLRLILKRMERRGDVVVKTKRGRGMPQVFDVPDRFWALLNKAA